MPAAFPGDAGEQRRVVGLPDIPRAPIGSCEGTARGTGSAGCHDARVTFLDLSHAITAGMSTYPGLPGPQVSDHLSYDASRAHCDEDTEFLISAAAMVTSTGTYLDAPRHRYRDGADIGAIPLERCTDLPAIVLDARGSTEIPAEVVPDDVQGCAVLVHTGWDRHWGSERYGSPDHPHLSTAATDRLVAGGAALVGIDSVNVDATTGRSRPVHTTLLRNDVLIVENLTGLAEVPDCGARFSATPLRFEGLPSFPVRAFATVKG